MIIVDTGCIPLIEPFFLKMRTYFFLDIIRTPLVINLYLYKAKSTGYRYTEDSILKHDLLFLRNSELCIRTLLEGETGSSSNDILYWISSFCSRSSALLSRLATSRVKLSVREFFDPCICLIENEN